MTQIEAMKQALEALENAQHFIDEYAAAKYIHAHNAAITSLRQAIAEAEKQEPRIPYFEVMSNALELYEFDQSTENHGALMQAVHNYVAEKEKPDDGYCQACDGDMCTARKGCVALDNPQPKVEQEPATKEQIREAIVFNLPLYTTPQPAQKPLTDEEIAEIFLGLYGSGIHHDDHVFARAIEAAHGIGEKK